MPTDEFLLTLGGILLLGLATDVLGQRSFLPRVTLLLLFGTLIGKQVFDLIPPGFTTHFDVIANMTLLLVGFLLGEKITHSFRQRMARAVFWVSLLAVLVTSGLVLLVLLLAGVELPLAILLACIASATAPAATVDVVLESSSDSPFADLLLGVVAIDDAWGLILFSLGLAMVMSLNGGVDHSLADTLLYLLRDIGGATVLGAAIGLPAAFLTGRIRDGQPVLMEALGLVFLCGGLAMQFDVSFLISAMVMGACVAAFARHHEYPFHAIRHIEWPFMSLFFVLAGAMLEIAALKTLGLVGLLYIISRIAGKLAGGWLGSTVAGCRPVVRRWMGMALLPQAGVSIGMAIIAANQFPDYRQPLLTLIISATVFFEIIGPVCTRMSLKATRQQLPIDSL